MLFSPGPVGARARVGWLQVPVPTPVLTQPRLAHTQAGAGKGPWLSFQELHTQVQGLQRWAGEPGTLACSCRLLWQGPAPQANLSPKVEQIKRAGWCGQHGTLEKSQWRAEQVTQVAISMCFMSRVGAWRQRSEVWQPVAWDAGPGELSHLLGTQHS